jgi:RNase P/RNase MRP subunit p29
VESVDGEDVILSTEDGNLEVRISDNTLLWVPGEPPTSTVQLAIGDPILAFGQRTEDEVGASTFSARLVLVADDNALPRVLVRGRVLAVTRQTIVVQSSTRERAITVLPRTRLWSISGRLDSLRDILPGDTLIALGQPTEWGQWVAGLVMVTGPEDTTWRGLRGTVVGLDAEELTLTIETRAGSRIAVLASADTRIRIPGVETASLGEIAEGDRVAVLGRFDPEDPDLFLARAIGVLAAPDQAED